MWTPDRIHSFSSIHRAFIIIIQHEEKGTRQRRGASRPESRWEKALVNGLVIGMELL
ncbi:hypothetical protein B0H19DRAFT_1187840, partial [Mycena capillaripes]